MEEFLKIIVDYIAIWAPSLVAILGMVVTIIGALSKAREAIKEFKNDETLKEMNKKLSKVINENEELVRCNKLLLEQITKIKDYADVKKEG